MSVNRPQLSQKAFVFWCQWIHLSCHKKHSCFDVSESTSAVTKSVRDIIISESTSAVTKSIRVLMSVNPPQLSQKAFVFWCQWIDLSCHKKRSCFDVSDSISAVTAMKMLQDLFCICDNCKNGVRSMQYVALKEYLFIACHQGIRKNFLRRGTKKGFPGSDQMIFQGRANSREIYFCQLETKLKIFWKHALIKLVIRIYQISKFRGYKSLPHFRRSCLSASTSVYVVIGTWTTPSPSAPTISITRWIYGRKAEDCVCVWSKHAETETLLTRACCDYVE